MDMDKFLNDFEKNIGQVPTTPPTEPIQTGGNSLTNPEDGFSPDEDTMVRLELTLDSGGTLSVEDQIYLMKVTKKLGVAYVQVTEWAKILAMTLKLSIALNK